jgi:hypothetical protein
MERKLARDLFSYLTSQLIYCEQYYYLDEQKFAITKIKVLQYIFVYIIDVPLHLVYPKMDAEEDNDL